MPTAEFEEKTYEKYFGHELGRYTKITFSPGQVAESTFGFDEAFYLNRLIWFLRFRHIFPGSRRFPAGVSLSEIERIGKDNPSVLPKIKFNVFIQYKRPEYINNHRASEWICWGSSYYRYRINKHQQEILFNIKDKSNGRATVVYAAPACWRINDLSSIALAGDVIKKSNIADVDIMVDHAKFSYVNYGNHGIGHSEPKERTSKDFLTTLKGASELSGVPFIEHIFNTVNLIERMVGSNVEGKLAFELAKKILLNYQWGDVSHIRDKDLFDPFITIEAFEDAFNVRLYAIG